MGFPCLLTIFRLITLIIVANLSTLDNANEPLMCSDPQCSGPIAIGEASGNYSPDQESKLRLKPGDGVDIYIRGVGEKLLAVVVRGKRGLVPSGLVREKNVKVPNLVPAQIQINAWLMGGSSVGHGNLSPPPPPHSPSKTISSPTTTTVSLHGHPTTSGNPGTTGGGHNVASTTDSQIHPVPEPHMSETGSLSQKDSLSSSHQPISPSPTLEDTTTEPSDTTVSPDMNIEHKKENETVDKNTQLDSIMSSMRRMAEKSSTKAVAALEQHLTSTGEINNLQLSDKEELKKTMDILLQLEKNQKETKEGSTATKSHTSQTVQPHQVSESASTETINGASNSVDPETKPSETFKASVSVYTKPPFSAGGNKDSTENDTMVNAGDSEQSAGLSEKSMEDTKHNSSDLHVASKLELPLSDSELELTEKEKNKGTNVIQDNTPSEQTASITVLNETLDKGNVNQNSYEMKTDEVSNHPLTEAVSAANESSINKSEKPVVPQTEEDSVKTLDTPPTSHSQDESNEIDSHIGKDENTEDELNHKSGIDVDDDEYDDSDDDEDGGDEIKSPGEIEPSEVEGSKTTTKNSSLDDGSNGKEEVLPSKDIDSGNMFASEDIWGNLGPLSNQDGMQPIESVLSDGIPDSSESSTTEQTQRSIDDEHAQVSPSSTDGNESILYSQEDELIEEPKAMESSGMKPQVEDPPTLESDEKVSVGDNSDVGSLFSLETIYMTLSNNIWALRSFLDAVASHLPGPVQLYLKSLDVSGISSRAVICLAVISFPCAIVLVGLIYMKERFKEHKMIGEFSRTEHELFLASSERDILRDDNKTLKNEVSILTNDLDKEKDLNSSLRHQLEDTVLLNDSVNSQKMNCLDEISGLHEKIADSENCITQLRDSIVEALKEKENLLHKTEEDERTINKLNKLTDKMNQDIKDLQAEKKAFIENEQQLKEKIDQLEQSCGQLLQEVKIWDTRVNELTEQVCNFSTMKEELDKVVESKDTEIESLKTAIENVDIFKNSMKDEDNDDKDKKFEALVNISAMQNKLNHVENEKEALIENLKAEKNKSLEMEVELLASRSETDKLKLNYNQALQDKAEAQTKLDVLSHYFKDKEMQLQKELGVQEAVRQQKEEHATHAERRVHLIEEENASYKYQVATLKQEIEETEHNLKNLIATQEKKAHDNWLAARAAERKNEELKHETTQLRQRLTLLEREQESLANNTQSPVFPGIIKPVAQRSLDTSQNSLLSQDDKDSNGSLGRHLPPPPGPPLDYMHRPIPMRFPPPIRPPFPMPPPYMRPPYDPMMPPMPPFRPPWHGMPDKHYDSDRRNTPSDFDSSMSGRHPSLYDRERESRSLSPVEPNNRSRNSTPPQPLPAFHNIPPPMPPRHHDYPQMTPHRGPPTPMKPRDQERHLPQSASNSPRNWNTVPHNQHRDAEV